MIILADIRDLGCESGHGISVFLSRYRYTATTDSPLVKTITNPSEKPFAFMKKYLKMN